jgi:hypothetical protein
MVTGWLFGVLEPKNTMRSVPSQSVYEQVVAP